MNVQILRRRLEDKFFFYYFKFHIKRDFIEGGWVIKVVLFSKHPFC